MNIIAKTFLTGAITILIGKDRWVKVKDAVLAAENSNLKGTEKYALVVTALKTTGLALARSLLNLAIEIAVATLTKSATDLLSK